MLRLQIGDARKCVWSGKYKDLAFNLLLDMSFIDNFVQWIFWTERKLGQCHLQGVTKLMQSLKNRDAVSFADH